jgi:hypothetical protein
MTDQEKFREHLEHASTIVEAWPAWKQNLLGRTPAETRRPLACTKCIATDHATKFHPEGQR